jgi:hypothetical protein
MSSNNAEQLEKGQLFEDANGVEVRITGVSKETTAWVTYIRTSDSRAFSVPEGAFNAQFTAKA